MDGTERGAGSFRNWRLLQAPDYNPFLIDGMHQPCYYAVVIFYSAPYKGVINER
jgi:hypothetical protein